MENTTTMNTTNVIDEAKEVSDLFGIFADVVRTAIDGMSSIPKDFEEFETLLEDQPVAKKYMDAIKEKFHIEDDDGDDDVTISEVGQFIGFLPYIEIILRHPRVPESKVNWKAKEILELL